MKRYIFLIILFVSKISYPLTVDEAVEKALKNFPDIAISQREVQIQQYDLEIAKGDFLPRLFFSSSLSYTDPDDAPETRSFYNELRLSYNLFSGFSHSTKLDISKYTLRTKELENLSITNMIVKNVKSAYYDALMYKRIYLFYDELYKNSLKTYEFTKSKFEAGRALSLDVLKSLTEVKKYETKKTELKNNLLNSLAVLGYYTDEKYDLDLELFTDFSNLDLKGFEYYFSKFEEGNPDLIAYNFKIQSANKQISHSKSSFMPSIDLYGAISRNDTKRGSLESDTNSSSVGVSLNWNLFNGFKDRNDYEKQKLNYYNTIEQKRKFVKDTKKEMLLIYNKIISALEMLTYQKELLKVTEENFKLTSEAYELGRATLIELLKAKDEMISSKIELINLQNSITQNYLILEYYTGGKL